MAPIVRETIALAQSSISLRCISSKLLELVPRALIAKQPSTFPDIAEALSKAREEIERRQSGTDWIIPPHYNDLNSGPAPGAVVGIVLGSVAGFLLIVWLLSTLTGMNGGNAIAGEEDIVIRKTPRSRRSRRSRSVREMREVEVSRSPRRERIIVEERERRTSMPPPPRRSRSIIVEERMETRVPGDDIVEVIEEASDFTTSSPPRRQRSRRSSGYRSVDPNVFVGGHYPRHSIGTSRTSS